MIPGWEIRSYLLLGTAKPADVIPGWEIRSYLLLGTVKQLKEKKKKKIPSRTEEMPEVIRFRCCSLCLLGCPGGPDNKRLACNAGDSVRSRGGEDPPEKEMAPHSSILAG